MLHRFWKRQQKVYTAEKMRLQLAETPAYCKGAVSGWFISIHTSNRTLQVFYFSRIDYPQTQLESH